MGGHSRQPFQGLEGFFLPVVLGWAFSGEADPDRTKSNTFSLEWLPKSGWQQWFPEVDRAGWFFLEEAGGKIVQGQVGFLYQLDTVLRTCSHSD